MNEVETRYTKGAILIGLIVLIGAAATWVGWRNVQASSVRGSVDDEGWALAWKLGRANPPPGATNGFILCNGSHDAFDPDFWIWTRLAPGRHFDPNTFIPGIPLKPGSKALEEQFDLGAAIQPSVPEWTATPIRAGDKLYVERTQRPDIAILTRADSGGEIIFIHFTCETKEAIPAKLRDELRNHPLSIGMMPSQSEFQMLAWRAKDKKQ